MTMNESASGSTHGSRGNWDDYVTVQEAAALLRVSTSTIWRWLKAGRMTAYRLGERRILLSRSDLGRLVKPAGDAGNRASVGEQEPEQPLTEGERQDVLAAVAAARALQAEMLRARGGKRFGSAAEEIARAREERSAARS
jgi:excisionase family DNA binding protein